jgi:hypothetical protein
MDSDDLLDESNVDFYDLCRRVISMRLSDSFSFAFGTQTLIVLGFPRDNRIDRNNQ